MPRARDICAAAYTNDVARLRLLTLQDVPGGLRNEFAVDLTDGASPPEGFNDLEAEEDEELDPDFLQAVENDAELRRLRKAYTIDVNAFLNEDEEGEANDEEDGDGGGGGRGGDANEPGADVEPVEDVAAAQEHDFALYRRIVKQQLRQRLIAGKVNQPGLLRLTGESPVDVVTYGVHFSAREVSRDAHPAIINATPTTDGHVTVPAEGNEYSSDSGTALCVSWKPSKRSTFEAYPLHWAVMGRAHEAVQFLLKYGADYHCSVGSRPPLFPHSAKELHLQTTGAVGGDDDNGAASVAHGGPTADAHSAATPSTSSGFDGKRTAAYGSPTALSATPADAAHASPSASTVFPPGLTAERMAQDNASKQTLQVLRDTHTAATNVLQSRELAKQRIESQLERRKARLEKRRLERDQRRAQAEEEASARAAERASRRRRHGKKKGHNGDDDDDDDDGDDEPGEDEGDEGNDEEEGDSALLERVGVGSESGSDASSFNDGPRDAAEVTMGHPGLM